MKAKADKQVRMNACEKYYAGLYSAKQICNIFCISPKTFDNWKDAYRQQLVDILQDDILQKWTVRKQKPMCDENGFVRVSSSAGYWR